MTEHEPPAHDDYWNDERPLTRLVLGHDAHQVLLRSHIASERFFGRGSETLFPLTEKTGERTYVQSRLYILPEGTRQEQRLADAHAWFYPAQQYLVFWELIASSWPWQPDQDPREGFVLRSLWLAYERFLADRFPSATDLFTTWEDNPYARADWQGFLTTVGYRQTDKAAFSKAIIRPGG